MGIGANERCTYCGTLVAAGVLSIIGYLGLAGLHGDYGLFSLMQIEAEEEELRSELALLEARRQLVSRRVGSLREGSLDLDLLDERARTVLGLGRSDEILIP